MSFLTLFVSSASRWDLFDVSNWPHVTRVACVSEVVYPELLGRHFVRKKSQVSDVRELIAPANRKPMVADVSGREWTVTYVHNKEVDTPTILCVRSRRCSFRNTIFCFFFCLFFFVFLVLAFCFCFCFVFVFVFFSLLLFFSFRDVGVFFFFLFFFFCFSDVIFFCAFFSASLEVPYAVMSIFDAERGELIIPPRRVPFVFDKHEVHHEVAYFGKKILLTNRDYSRILLLRVTEEKKGAVRLVLKQKKNHHRLFKTFY